MKFELNMEKIGCGPKIPIGILRDSVKNLQLGPMSDASSFRWGGSWILQSIDKVGRFSASLNVFASMAVDHIFKDVLVSGGHPLACSYCFELGPEMVNQSDIEALTRFVIKRTEEYGARIGNLHTVRSEYTFITGCVMGERSHEEAGIDQPGSVYLTQPLGFASSIIMNELNDDDDDLWKQYNGFLVKKAVQSKFFSSDVSGFGLAGTLENVALEFGLEIDVKIDTSRAVIGRFYEVPIDCLANDESEFPHVVCSSHKAKSIAFRSEISGPQAIFCSFSDGPKMESDFQEEHGFSPIKIGNFEFAKTPSVKVSVL